MGSMGEARGTDGDTGGVRRGAESHIILHGQTRLGRRAGLLYGLERCIAGNAG